MKETIIEVDIDTLLRIQESYSADVIAQEKRIRKPIKFDGKHYVSVGGWWKRNIIKGEECYLLVPQSEFPDKATYYGQKLTWPVTLIEEEREYGEDWDALRRSQPEGFYHRMLVKRGSQEFVLLGPPVIFIPKADTVETKQLALF